MKITRLDLPVTSSWIEENGLRLDPAPYLSGSFEAKVILERLAAKKEPLQEVTRGIFSGPRFSRNYVQDPEYGIPFLGSVDILEADLSHLPLISKKTVKKNPDLLIDENWTLITCSGTIGRMVYSRAEMKGMAGSQHFMRVVPDPEKILPGYLYAYLSSKFGIPQIISGTYGAIIQHIEPSHIKDLLVPRLGEAIEAEVHQKIQASSHNFQVSIDKLEEANKLLIESIGDPGLDKLEGDALQGFSATISETALNRIDSFYYNPKAQHLDQWLLNHPNGCKPLHSITEDIFEVPLFKHIYVEKDQGIPFFTSADLFKRERVAPKYISPITKNIQKYILREGWILLARSGQLGGNIGIPQYCDSKLDGAATSDHVLRIIPKSNVSTSGFLYCYLYSSSFGYPLAVRNMTGHSIPYITPGYFREMLVPNLDFKIQLELDDLVKTAFNSRNKSLDLEDEAVQLVETAIEEGANG